MGRWGGKQHGTQGIIPAGGIAASVSLGHAADAQDQEGFSWRARFCGIPSAAHRLRAREAPAASVPTAFRSPGLLGLFPREEGGLNDQTPTIRSLDGDSRIPCEDRSPPPSETHLGGA